MPILGQIILLFNLIYYAFWCVKMKFKFVSELYFIYLFIIKWRELHFWAKIELIIMFWCDWLGTYIYRYGVNSNGYECRCWWVFSWFYQVGLWRAIQTIACFQSYETCFYPLHILPTFWVCFFLLSSLCLLFYVSVFRYMFWNYKRKID